MSGKEVKRIAPTEVSELLQRGQLTRVTAPVPKTEPETSHPMIERAKEMLGGDFLGVDAVRRMEDKLKTIGVDIHFNTENLPQANWNEKDLEWAQENGEMLVLSAGSMTQAGVETDITLHNFQELFRAGDPLRDGRNMFRVFLPDRDNWYGNEPFANESGHIKLEWRFVRKAVIFSTAKPDGTLSDLIGALLQYGQDIKNSGALRHDIESRTAVETAYDSVLYYLNRNSRLLSDIFALTSHTTDNGENFIAAGGFTAEEGFDFAEAGRNINRSLASMCPKR